MARDTVPVPAADPSAAWASKRCASCGDPFRCGADTPSCWCDGIALTADQRGRLAALQLTGCLCRNCLEAL